MSNARTARSEDIVRLRHAHLEVAVREGHLIVGHVPYVDRNRQVLYGTLVSTLEVTPDGKTVRPGDHRVWLAGERPCDKNGTAVTFICEQRTYEIIPGLTVNFGFSLKPDGGYGDYFQKMMNYIGIFQAAALAIDETATPVTNTVVESDDEDDSPFVYEDTASTRAGIRAISAKLRLPKVAIVGLGGTGGYILDLVAKCPVGEIHLFDGDTFEQHNAFRAPGAASVAQMKEAPFKVDYFTEAYRNMRRGVVPHAYAMDEAHAEELRDMDFVFLSLGDGRVRQLLSERLEAFDVEFIDVGLSVSQIDGGLSGMLRVTTSLRGHREEARSVLTFSDGEAEDVYSRNIQLAPLNSLNAALAVARWMRHYGFLIDQEGEVESLYMTVGNGIANEVSAE